jgi:hypothetical protein
VRHFSHPCPFFRCGHHPFPLQQRKNSHPCPFVHAAVHMCIVANRFFPIVNHGSAFLFSQCCLIKVGWTFHICILTLGTVRLNLVYINQLTYDFSYSGEISVQSKYFSYIYFFFEFLYRFGDETLVVHLCDYSIGGTSLLFV